jgi:hypothetical protein
LAAGRQGQVGQTAARDQKAEQREAGQVDVEAGVDSVRLGQVRQTAVDGQADVAAAGRARAERQPRPPRLQGEVELQRLLRQALPAEQQSERGQVGRVEPQPELAAGQPGLRAQVTVDAGAMARQLHFDAIQPQQGVRLPEPAAHGSRRSGEHQAAQQGTERARVAGSEVDAQVRLQRPGKQAQRTLRRQYVREVLHPRAQRGLAVGIRLQPAAQRQGLRGLQLFAEHGRQACRVLHGQRELEVAAGQCRARAQHAAEGQTVAGAGEAEGFNTHEAGLEACVGLQLPGLRGQPGDAQGLAERYEVRPRHDAVQPALRGAEQPVQFTPGPGLQAAEVAIHFDAGQRTLRVQVQPEVEGAGAQGRLAQVGQNLDDIRPVEAHAEVGAAPVAHVLEGPGAVQAD